MKQKIAAIISLPILLAHPMNNAFADAPEVNKCSSATRCSSYVFDTYVQYGAQANNTSYCAAQEYGYCLWYPDNYDICLTNGSGHDKFDTCANVCENTGYDVYVIDISTKEWGCACKKDSSFIEWRTYSTRRERRYTPQYTSGATGAGCNVTAVATSEYRCRTGYYGTATSDTACTTCPSNATCNTHTTFNCNNGYYVNASKTGCTKCPNSKEGGLGWDSSGNGVDAVGGPELAYCSIPAGTVLHDSTGTFIITDDAMDGCEYDN